MNTLDYQCLPALETAEEMAMFVEIQRGPCHHLAELAILVVLGNSNPKGPRTQIMGL